MFTSINVLKNPKCLTGHNVSSSHKIPNWVRTDILLSHKVIVDNEFIKNYEDIVPIAETAEGILNGSIPLLKMDDKKYNAAFEKHKEHYFKYVRMPFKYVLFELPLQSVCLEEISEHSFKLFIVENSGFVNPYYYIVTISENGDYAVEDKKMYKWDNDISRYRNRDYDIPMMTNFYGKYSIFYAIEILLFLNTRNTVIHQYKPTKDEIKNIPKPLIEKYTYHVLDVFRDKRNYQTLADVERDMYASQETAARRRAHFVTGHFKQKKNGLFWWNSFMRCRKNISTAGYADKDYHLVVK